MRHLTCAQRFFVFLVIGLLGSFYAVPATAEGGSPGYVVVGDSVEAGFGASSPEKAYVPLFHTYLESDFGTDVQLHNFAIPGATVLDINQQQVAAAVYEIESHDSVVVTWGGGGNDLLEFINSPQAITCLMGSLGCLNRLEALLNNLEHLADLAIKQLRIAAGTENTIIVRTQYNPLLKASCGGPDDPLARLAHIVLEGQVDTSLVRGLNDRIRDLAVKHGAKIADLYWLFALNSENLVSEDCVHPSDMGHDAISKLFISAF